MIINCKEKVWICIIHENNIVWNLKHRSALLEGFIVISSFSVFYFWMFIPLMIFLVHFSRVAGFFVHANSLIPCCFRALRTFLTGSTFTTHFSFSRFSATCATRSKSSFPSSLFFSAEFSSILLQGTFDRESIRGTEVSGSSKEVIVRNAGLSVLNCFSHDL